MRTASPEACPARAGNARAAWTMALLLALTFVFVATRVDSGRLAGAGDALRQTIVLRGGTTIDVPARPMRILPASTALLDWLEPLVDPARLVAVPNLTEKYSLVATSPRATEFLARPRFAHFLSDQLTELAPDLVLVQAWHDQATRDRLVESGIAVVELPLVAEWNEVLDGTRLLGELLDEGARAADLVADLTRRRELLAERRRGHAPRVVVYANYNSGSIGTVTGKGSTMHLCVELAGARNAAAERGLAQHADADLELLFTLDPDVLVIPHGDDGGSTTRDYIRSTRALDGLRAVREGHIAELDGRLIEAASFHVLYAAEALATELERLGL
jgi:iron complex transport system substrate-binding protein